MGGASYVEISAHAELRLDRNFGKSCSAGFNAGDDDRRKLLSIAEPFLTYND